jgi:serine/threonine protein phosphatase PrpC
MLAIQRLPLEWAMRTKALDGARDNGDLLVTVPFAQGLLIAVIDGLGHGEEAAAAAQAAESVLHDHAGAPVETLIHHCHKALQKTRGAVMSMASFRTVATAADKAVMEWVGVGNVEGVLFRADGNAKQKRESLMLRGGVVGYQIPPLHASKLTVSCGDILILVTDGIDRNFSSDLPLDQSPDIIAESIFARHAKGTDDALVCVARYIG